jgi:hypothetical protein
VDTTVAEVELLVVEVAFDVEVDVELEDVVVVVLTVEDDEDVVVVLTDEVGVPNGPLLQIVAIG